MTTIVIRKSRGHIALLMFKDLLNLLISLVVTLGKVKSWSEL